jgi:CRP-like cAMP-binding protein
MSGLPKSESDAIFGTSMDELEAFIRSRVDVSDANMAIILAAFKEKRLKTNGLLLRKGQIASAYWFLSSGSIRISYGSGSVDTTGWVTAERLLFTELESLTARRPTEYTIQAMEPTVLRVISSTDMESLYAEFPFWQAFGRILWQEAFVTLLQRIVAHQSGTAKDRYAQLLKDPELIKRIPLKHLATYLGVTPTSLSRLRRSIR